MIASSSPPDGALIVRFTKQDFLVGKEYFCQENLGNETVRKKIDEYYDEYERVALARRRIIRKEIVQSVKETGGRFLERRKDQSVLSWREMSEEEALVRVANQFKNKKRRGKKGANGRAVVSSKPKNSEVSHDVDSAAPKEPDSHEKVQTQPRTEEVFFPLVKRRNPVAGIPRPPSQVEEKSAVGPTVPEESNSTKPSLANGPFVPTKSNREVALPGAKEKSFLKRRTPIIAGTRPKSDVHNAKPHQGTDPASGISQGDDFSIDLSCVSLLTGSSVGDGICRCCEDYPNIGPAKCPLCGMERPLTPDTPGRDRSADLHVSVEDEKEHSGDSAGGAEKADESSENANAQLDTTTTFSASEAAPNFSSIFRVIGIDPEENGAKILLSSIDDNFDSVQKLMTTPEPSFEAQLRGYGFDNFEYCRLRDFRIWFQMWHLRARVKPPLTNETWLAFREACRSGGLYDSTAPFPSTAGRPTSPIVDDSSSENPQEPRNSHPYEDIIAEIADNLDDEMLSAIDTSYQDDNTEMSLMIRSVGTLSLSSSQKQQALDDSPHLLSADKAGKRALSIGSQSNESDRKPPPKKTPRNVVNDSTQEPQDVEEAKISRSSTPDPKRLLSLLSAADETSEAQRPPDLPTIAEDGPVGASGNAAADSGQPSRHGSSSANSAPLSHVMAESFGNVSSFTSTEGRDHLSGEMIQQGAGVVEADVSGWSVGLVRPVTRDDRKISVLSISSQKDVEAYLRHIVQTMKHDLHDANSQIRCCGDISKVIWEDEWDVSGGADRRRLLLRQALIVAALRAMKTHAANPKLVKYALTAIDDLCKDADETFVRDTHKTMAMEVVKSMKMAPTCAVTQHCATLTLAKLVGNEQICEAIIEADGLQHILIAMQEHRTRAAVQENGCLLLLGLSAHYKIRKAIPANDVVQVVLQMMPSHPTNGDLQEHGCVLLSRFYKGKGSTLVGREGVNTVVAAIEQNSPRGRLLKHAYWLFGNLAYEDEDSSQDLVAANGIEAIVSSMKEHAEQTQIQMEGCRALSMLAYRRNAGVCHHIVAAGGISVVADAMERHKTNEDVQKYCCWTFQNLAEGDSTCRSQIRKQGGVRLMQRAKSSFPNLAWDVKAALRFF